MLNFFVSSWVKQQFGLHQGFNLIAIGEILHTLITAHTTGLGHHNHNKTVTNHNSTQYENPNNRSHYRTKTHI